MPLRPDRAIAALGKRTRQNHLLVREEDLVKVLKPYKLQDALIAIGWWSLHTHFYEPERLEGKTLWKEPKAGIHITQHALAYLANLCLISRSGDYKAPLLSANEDNVPMLCSIYNNLPDPLEFEDDSIPGEERFQALIFRWHAEQMVLQFRPNYLLGRTLLMFLDPACGEVARLNDVFTQANAFSINEYLKLAFTIYGALRERPAFTSSAFSTVEIPELQVDLSEDAINRFLGVLKTDYVSFRNRDEEMNHGADPLYTRNRYNPLKEYPIIEANLEGAGQGFIIPNVIVFLHKAFGGLFWWFHTYYESEGRSPLDEFRTPFGKVFENYVGTILKGIYGNDKVHGEVLFGDGRRFIDWYVEEGNKIYLFEAKSYQFALSLQRTGYKQTFLENEASKITDAIKQVYKRIKDIEKYEELSRFRGKEIVPIIVLLDMPYLWSRFFHEWIKEAQVGLAEKEGIPELRDFKIYLMSIRDLEFCDGVANRVAIEAVLEKATENVESGFESILEEQLGRPLENRLLETTCHEFLDTILKIDDSHL